MLFYNIAFQKPISSELTLEKTPFVLYIFWSASQIKLNKSLCFHFHQFLFHLKVLDHEYGEVAFLCSTTGLGVSCSLTPHSCHCSLSDSAVTSDDLLAWLHPFCGDSALPVRPRIDVLQILESNFSLRDSDVRLLLLYRTQAVLKDREVRFGYSRRERCEVSGGGGGHFWLGRVFFFFILPKVSVCFVVLMDGWIFCFFFFSNTRSEVLRWIWMVLKKRLFWRWQQNSLNHLLNNFPVEKIFRTLNSLVIGIFTRGSLIIWRQTVVRVELCELLPPQTWPPLHVPLTD